MAVAAVTSRLHGLAAAVASVCLCLRAAAATSGSVFCPMLCDADDVASRQLSFVPLKVLLPLLLLVAAAAAVSAAAFAAKNQSHPLQE